MTNILLFKNAGMFSRVDIGFCSQQIVSKYILSEQLFSQ